MFDHQHFCVSAALLLVPCDEERPRIPFLFLVFLSECVFLHENCHTLHVFLPLLLCNNVCFSFATVWWSYVGDNDNWVPSTAAVQHQFAT